MYFLKNKKTTLLFFLFLVFSLFLFSAEKALSFYSDEFKFSRDLRVGDSGRDVYELQVFLNKDHDTRLANHGPGSPGSETHYFGQITRNAVIRFQQKYAEDILHPLGLRSGTGYFGPSTRAKVNDILKKEAEKNNVTITPPHLTDPFTESDYIKEEKEKEELRQDSFPPPPFEDTEVIEHASPADPDQLSLTYSSSHYGRRGSVLKIYGFGFSSENKVYFEDLLLFNNLSASDNQTLTVVIPEYLKNGFYQIEVENEKGRTKDSQVFFVVTDHTSVSPKIERVVPSRGGWGTRVMVYGSGFDNNRNIIRTPYGIIDNVLSPDGNTLILDIKPFPDTPGVEKDVKIPGGPHEIPIKIFIVNDGGVTEEPGEFILDY